MTTHNIHYFFAFAFAGVFVSCNNQSSNHQAEVSEHQAEEDGEPHEAEERSDLDRPIDELVSLACEHQIKTYECDECRYETGFVKVASSIAKEGLISTAQPTYRKVAVPLALTGEVRFDERRVAHLSTQVEGIIRQVHVAIGDDIKRGRALVEIESVSIGEDQAAYLEAQGMLELARRNFERMSELRKENIASEKEYLITKQELDAAEIRATNVLNKLNRLGTGPTAKGRLVLRSPIDGKVLLLHAVSGEVVKTDESLATVGNNATVWVWADLYEQDIAAVKAALKASPLKAEIAVKAYPSLVFQGIVDLVSPAMDELSRTAKVRAQVNNADERLLCGMFATVTLFLSGDQEVLSVPKNAVLEDEGRSFVFVHYQGDYYIRRPITAGKAWLDWIEITKGLDPSKRIVVDGAFLLKSDVLRSKMGAGCAD